jgi:hypothetical protein
MRTRLIPIALLLFCLLLMAVVPAAAAPQPQASVTHYVLIDATTQPPTVAFSTVSGVQVQAVGGYPYSYSFDITFNRTFRYLVATAYGICTGPNWDCPQYVSMKYVLRDGNNPRVWRLVTNYEKPMISLLLKP